MQGRIEPRAPSWQKATKADREAFYDRAGEVAVRVLRQQLLAGVGADGHKMEPRQRPRADGATGPVLSPHRAESRTVRLLDYHAWDGGVTLFWHGAVSRMQKLPWATILSYHAEGLVIGAYLRDVRLSDRYAKKIADEMATWWGTRVRSRAARAGRSGAPAAVGVALPQPAPAPLAARPGLLARAKGAFKEAAGALKRFFGGR